MAQLAIGQLIKIIIGIFVVIAVVAGLYMIFRDNVFSFFKNLPGANDSNIILGLLR